MKEMYDIRRMWPNIAFLSTLLLSSDWGFDYFWLKKKTIASNCASALSSARIVYIFCYLFIIVVDDNDGVCFYFIVICIWIYKY